MRLRRGKMCQVEGGARLEPAGRGASVTGLSKKGLKMVENMENRVKLD